MADKPPDNLPAPIDTEGKLEISIPPQLDPTSTLAPIWSSFKPTTALDKAKLLAAFQGKQEKLSGMINRPLVVSNVAFQGVMLTDKDTGERFSATRSIVFTPDGKSYAAISEGIRSSLGMIFQLYGRPPWTPGLPLLMRQLETADGKRYFYLEYDTETAPEPTGRKR